MLSSPVDHEGYPNTLNIGIDRFGESAPGKEVAKYLGLDFESVKNKIIQAYSKTR